MIKEKTTRKNVPEVRFEGYKGEWERKELGEIFSYERPDKYIVNNEDYSDRYDTPVLTANKGFLLGYTNEKRTYNEPSIIFDDFTLDSKFVDFPYMLKSSAIKILTINDESKDDLKFSHELLNHTKIENLGHARHYISIVQPTKVNIPSKSEQSQIGTLFQQLDNQISHHRTKLQKLQHVKQAMLTKMFPQNGAKVPEVRFEGFEGDWESSYAKHICSISTGKSNTQDRIDNGPFPFYVRSPIIERSKKYLFDEEAVLTVGDGVGTGKVFHYVNGKYDLHQRVYRMFNFDDVVSAKFFYYFFSINFYDRVMSMTAKTSVDSVRMEMIADMEILFPSRAEQNKIVSFFDSLDALLSQHQKQLDKLGQIKSALLDKLFV